MAVKIPPLMMTHIDRPFVSMPYFFSIFKFLHPINKNSIKTILLVTKSTAKKLGMLELRLHLFVQLKFRCILFIIIIVNCTIAYYFS